MINNIVKGNNQNGHIKECPKCKAKFTLEQLFYDPDIIPIGLCFQEDCPDLNIYFFNHEADACQTTFTVEVEKFSSFIDGKIPKQKLSGTAACEDYCNHIDDDGNCSQDCHYAPFRVLLIKMREAKAATLLGHTL